MEKKRSSVYWLFLLLLLQSVINHIEAAPMINPGIAALYQEDVILTDPQRSLIETLTIHNHSPPAPPGHPREPQHAVARIDSLKWTDGIIPYIMDATLTHEMVTAIQEAINDFENKTCVRFVTRTANDTDYVRFSYGHSCSSFIGRVGGEQQVYIGVNCAKKGVVIHEIFHALGRWHEHSRPDREQYISINYNSIIKGYERDFERTSSSFVTTQGIPYDYDSLLHYKAHAFTSDGKPTLKPRDQNVDILRLGQREGFSENDILHVKSLYCPDDKGHWSSWSTWSSCSRTCNGGLQSRTRVCVGGIDCKGSNIEERHCGLIHCPILPVWSVWSEWSSCSSTCGSGRRSRLRVCTNGTMCTNGTSHQFEDCYLIACPQAPVWNNWSSWSECSSTCQGGYRYRTRRCRNGSDKDCTGPSRENESCNTYISCSSSGSGEGGQEIYVANNTWSSCSKSCGSGIQYMRSENGTVINTRSCNIQPCHDEYCLQGIRYEGCYRFNKQQLNSLENTLPLLMDSPENRDNPLTKCALATHSNTYTLFALSQRACYMLINTTNSSSLNGSFSSDLCQNGTGIYNTTNSQLNSNVIAVDVYSIVDDSRLIDSIVKINKCGSDYCSSNDTLVQCNTELLTSSSTYSIYSMTNYNYVLLLLLSIISIYIYL